MASTSIIAIARALFQPELYWSHGMPGGGVVPVNTILPTIYGPQIIGQTLTASTGTWNKFPTSYAYQWQREGVAISGATASAYTAVAADLSATLTCAVTASNAAGASFPAIGFIAGLIKIMPLGDSITNGTSSPSAVPGGYRAPLWTTLENDGYNIAYAGSLIGNPSGSLPFSNHEGHGGYTISTLSGTAPGTILDGIANHNWLSVNPDIILLLIGINDFFGGRTTAQANTDYTALLNDILTKLPSVKVICATLVQQGSGWVDTFNANLATLVAASGPRVSLVDTHSALTAGDLSSDNTHPNQGGYNKMAPVWESGVKAIAPLTLGSVINATAFYVSSSTGLDTNAGTQAAPWQTLAKVNAAALTSGTSVLFKRGDIWRDGNGGTLSGLHAARLIAQSGVHYDAYGTGANPRFMGSVSAASTGNWTNVSGNIWKSTLVFAPTAGNANGLPFNNANDIGNVFWGTWPNYSFGTMALACPTVWDQNTADLISQGMWLFMGTSGSPDYKVYIYSVGNPATTMPGLELGMDASIIELPGNTNNVIIQNITISNGAGHGINYGAATNITIRDMIIGWIGGGDNGGSGGSNPRFGNGIQLNGGSSILVERNQVFQCYDGGITQENTSNGAVSIHDVTYRNNVITMCPAAALAIPGAHGAGSSLFNIFTYNNTIINAGIGWASTPRCGGNNPAVALSISETLPSSSFIVNNNVFIAHRGADAIITDVGGIRWGHGVLSSNYNAWYDSFGVFSVFIVGSTPPFATWAAGYSPALDANSLVDVNPQLTDNAPTTYSLSNFRPLVGSPLFNAGTNLFSAGVVWDINKKPRPVSGPFTIGALQ